MSVTAAPEHESRPESGPVLPPSMADTVFRWICRAAAIGILVLAAALVVSLVWEAAPFFQSGGWSLMSQVPWNPGGGVAQFGGLALIYGTLVTSAIAMLLAVPFGVGTAVFLAEIAPARVRQVGAFLVELLA